MGLVRFTIPEGRFRCSGTLIAPTVVLTAGPCTQDATNVDVSFDDALQPDPLQPGISAAERAAREAHYIVQERRPATSFLKNVQREVVVFQINQNDSKAGGGSCFGDSGAPRSSTGSCSATSPT